MLQVFFAGYKVPHLLHPYFLIKIQIDSTIARTSTEVPEQACPDLIGKIASLEATFEEQFQMRSIGGAVSSIDDPYGTGAATSLFPEGRDYLDF